MWNFVSLSLCFFISSIHYLKHTTGHLYINIGPFYTFLDTFFIRFEEKQIKKADEANKTTILSFCPSSDIISPISYLRTHKN